VSVPVYLPVFKPLAVSANARHGISSWISFGGGTVQVRDRESGKLCDALGLQNHIECAFGEAKSPPHQATARVGLAVDPAKFLVIRSDEEPLSVGEVPELEDSPHDAEAFSLRNGVVFHSSSESSAPISDKMKQLARLLLEEGTTNLVGACVNVNDELPIGLRQGN